MTSKKKPAARETRQIKNYVYGKRRTTICFLPKMEESCLILAHFLRQSRWAQKTQNVAAKIVSKMAA